MLFIIYSKIYIGQFENTKMPFGFSTSPSVFAAYKNTIFQEVIGEDQISIYG